MSLHVEKCENAPSQHLIWSWQAGVIRGLPTLQNFYMPKITPPTAPATAYCVHIGVNPTNGTCRYDGTEHAPGIRECYDDKQMEDAAGAGGGNPVGTGFQYSAASGGIIKSLSCVDEHGMCLGVQESNAIAIVPCSDPRAQGWSTETEN